MLIKPIKPFIYALLANLVLAACAKDTITDPNENENTPDKTADVVVTVSNQITGKSEFMTGLSHVDYTLRGGGKDQDASAQAKAKELLSDAIGMNATHIHAFGVASTWPDPAESEPTVWWSLDQQMDLFKEMGGTPAVIFYNWPWHMRGVFSNGTTTLVTEENQFQVEGRILTSKMPQFDILTDRLARRYMAPPYNVRHFVLGNEMKGFYVRKDGASGLWDSGIYPGTPGDNADHGYTYLWNRWAGVMRGAAADIGINPDELVLIGPYAAVRSEAAPSNATVEAGHPLYGKTYGEFRKNAIETLDTFMKNADHPGGIAFDAGSRNALGGELVDIYGRQGKWADMMDYIRNHVGGTGTNLPVFVAETYLRRADDETATEDQYASFKSVGMLELVRSGYTSAWLWGPLGKGEPGSPEGGLMTGTETASGAQPKAWYYALKTIHEEFPPETDLYDVTISDGDAIDALANATKIFLVNKTSLKKTVAVNGTDYSLKAYECKAVDWK